ncbi:MAG: SIMPL domain-containing protein, partial [Woeseiaceae bacterium]
MTFGTFARAALLAALGAGFPASAVAQGQPAAARSISVVGQGEASGRPDKAQISAGVQTAAATVAQAAQQNQAVVAEIMRALDGEDIDEKDIQTANYSIWPEQHHDPRQPGQVQITGYRVSNVVNVTIGDIGKVGEVLAAVTNAGANSIHGIQFMVEDKAALEQRARAAA